MRYAVKALENGAENKTAAGTSSFLPFKLIGGSSNMTFQGSPFSSSLPTPRAIIWAITL